MTIKATTDQMNAKLEYAEQIAKRNAIYKHKSGGEYMVLGHAFDTDTMDVRVTYRRIGGPEFDRVAERYLQFSRPLSEWTLDRFAPLQ
jgi:hypothetical protein